MYAIDLLQEVHLILVIHNVSHDDHRENSNLRQIGLLLDKREQWSRDVLLLQGKQKIAVLAVLDKALQQRNSDIHTDVVLVENSTENAVASTGAQLIETLLSIQKNDVIEQVRQVLNELFVLRVHREQLNSKRQEGTASSHSIETLVLCKNTDELHTL